MQQPTMSRASLAWRIAVSIAGIALLFNGSLRMEDDVWPFGPLSQYAFSPARDSAVAITRVEGQLADGRRIDLPLRVEESGISRAEIEARIPTITGDPSLLRAVSDGWSARHAGSPALRQVWLVQDTMRLGDAGAGPKHMIEIATWVVTP